MKKLKEIFPKIILLITLFSNSPLVKGLDTGIYGPQYVLAGQPYSYYAHTTSTHCSEQLAWSVNPSSMAAQIIENNHYATVIFNCPPSGQSSTVVQLIVGRDECVRDWASDDPAVYHELTIVVVASLPVAAPIVGADIVCENSTITYTTLVVADATYYDWTLPSGGGSVVNGQGTNTVEILWDDIPSSTINISKQLKVTPSSGSGCVGTPSFLAVTVENISPFTISSSPPLVCGGSNQSYIVTPSFATNVNSYIWDLPVGVNITSGSGTANTEMHFDPYAQSGPITVTSMYACGIGYTTSTNVNVTVLPFPPSTIQGALAVCEGTTTTYGIEAIANADYYTWTVVGGVPSSTTTTVPYVTVTWNTPGTGTIAVKPYNQCGESPANSTINVIVHPNSSAIIVDNIEFNHSELLAQMPDYLVFNHCQTSNNCSNKVIDKATLMLNFNTGDDYNYGSSQAFNTSVKVQIIGINNGGVYVIDKTVDLTINQISPEQSFQLDFSDEYYQIQSFEIKILAYNGNALVANTIQLTAEYIEEFKYNALTTTPMVSTISAIPVAGSNQYVFTWSNSCSDFPNYEIQLLRLFNKEHDEPTVIDKTINWDEALDVETHSSSKSIKLTIAEGTGYYVWRVRPIGNFVGGGIENDKNWGLWSNHSGYEQGNDIDIPAPVATYIINYTQFDENINWIYSRTFTEGNVHDNQQVRIGENITFANGLQQVKQTQAHISTNNNILTTQTVNDYAGRPALSSMPVPLKNKTSLGFEPNFLKKDAANAYTAEDFDTDLNFNIPTAVYDAAGSHFDYYSDANTDVTIPSAESFPFTRTLFYNDGNSRVKEQSGVGETFKIKADPTTSKTNKTYYAGVADDELIRVFGDEAPLNTSVHKVINVDGNQTASITYIGKEGKTLATCLSTNGKNKYGEDVDALMGLQSQQVAGFPVLDIIDNTTPYGDYGNQATTTRTFVEETPTTVNIHYDLTPKSIEDICLNYCSTCDYYIEIIVQNIEDPANYVYYREELLPSGICGGTITPFVIDDQVVLPKGTYIFTKRVVANNTDPSTITATNPIGSTYFENQVQQIRASYEDQIYGTTGTLAIINAFLDAGDIDGLYLSLGVNLNNPPERVSIDIGTVDCPAIFDIPVVLCPQKICPAIDNNVSFANYFDDFWAAAHAANTSIPAYKFALIQTNYTNASFDLMVQNMVSDGYSCEVLWDCWYSNAQSYHELLALYATPGMPVGLSFNLVDVFLDCAGRRITSFTSVPQEAIDFAYKTFLYTPGTNLLCEDYFENDPSGCTIANFENCSNLDLMNNFYECVTNADPNATPIVETDPYLAAQAMTDTCELYCEYRRAGFTSSIIEAFHQNQEYVGANPDVSATALFPYSGDIYQLELVSEINQFQFNDLLLLPAETPLVPWTEIECMTEALVDHCKAGCTITVVLEENGPGTADDQLIMGTPEEQQAFQNSFVSAYEVSIHDDGVSCDAGWETISSNLNTTTLPDGTYIVENVTETILTANSLSYITGQQTTVVSGGVIISVTMNNWTSETASFTFYQSNTFGGSGQDVLKSTFENLNGDQILIGSSTSNDGDVMSNFGSTDGWIIKIDATYNNLLASKNIGGSSEDVLNAGFQLASSDYLFHGYSTSSDVNLPANYGNIDAWATMVSEDFSNLLVSKNFGGSNIDAFKQVIELPDGNFLFLGNSMSNDIDLPNNYGGNDVWVMRTDANLNIIWSQNYGGSGEDLALSFFLFTGNEITIVSTSTSTDFDSQYGIHGGARWAFKINIGSGDILSGFVALPSTGQTSSNCDLIEIRNGITIGNGEDFVITYVEGLSNCYFSSSISNPFVIPPPVDCYDDFCFRYVPWPTIPEDAPEVLPITCEESAAQDIRNAIEQVAYEYIEAQVEAFENNYSNTCVNPENIDDHFWLTYPLGYHHYTLYYYNRAGNLIQTVPPQGVDLLDRDNINDAFDNVGMNRNTSPNHRFVTDYEYNSLGQLVKQTTPDGGATYFYYNKLGQLRFSQNEKQLGDGTNPSYSYTKYDKLGRIIEVGESTQAALAGDFQNNVNVVDFPTLPVGDPIQNSQVTYTVYTDLAPNISYLNDGLTFQEYLQNRVSYNYTDEDGDVSSTKNDQTYTYYSYDPHGNVKWLVQDIPGFLDKQYIRYEYDLVSGNVLKVSYNESKLDQFYHRYTYDADNRIVLAETSKNNMTWDKDAGYEYYAHGPLRRTEIGEDHVQGLDYVYTIHGWLKALNHASLDKTLDPGHDGTNATNNFAKDVFAMQLGYFTGDFNRTSSPYNSANLAALNPATNRSLYNGNISTWASNNVPHPNSLGVDPYPGLTGYQYRYDELNRIKTANFRQNVDLSGFSGDVSAYSTNYNYDANGNLYQLNRNGKPTDLTMDALAYHYYDKAEGIYDESLPVPSQPTNKLAYVSDGSSNYFDDIDGQAIGNYSYDEIGNLITDASEDIAEIKWTVYGKVKEIIRTSGSTKPNLKFIYDASGNRIAKIVIPDVADDAQNTITWYSRDASGNVMAVYESEYETTANGLLEKIYLAEQSIYGSSRVGEYKKRTLLKTIDEPSIGLPTEYLAGLSSKITESTNMLIGVQKPFKKTVSPNQTVALISSTGAKQEVNFINPTSPVISAPNATFNFGEQGKNFCVVEDDYGNIIFSAFTAKQIGNPTSVSNVCRVLDANNNLMSIPLNNPIKSNYEGKSLGIKKPGSNNIYYLITVGTDLRAYYHEIDISTGQVIPNAPIDPIGINYGYGMALIEDNSGNASSKLFLRKYNANQTTDIVSFDITSSGFQNQTIVATFNSKDVLGKGELQISPDGSKLSVANQKNTLAWWTTDGEIRVYGLNPYHEITGLVTTFSTGGKSSLQSLDFSPSSKNIYYSQVNIGKVLGTGGGVTKGIYKLDVVSNLSSLVISNVSGDVRRAKDQNIYVAAASQDNLQQITNPDGVVSVSIFALATLPWKITDGIPLQPHKILDLEQGILTRELTKKTYEINDHLGNVRAVVSDLKESTITAGIPTDFIPDIVAINNYYAFHSIMPGRSFNSSGYRYGGANGQEKDDEITGVTGSHYTAEFWEYDSRTGKRWNIDPIVKPWESPYSTYGGNPILNVDIKGDDWYRHNKTGKTVWLEKDGAEIKGYTFLGEYRYWNNVTSYGKWQYWNFAGRGNAGKWIYNNILADGAWEGSENGPGYYGGKVGWEKRGGKELFFGTIGTILSGGALLEAEGVMAIAYASYQMALSVDDITTVFYDDNRTALTELGISKEDLGTIKTVSNAVDFAKGLKGLIETVANNPNTPIETYEAATLMIQEIDVIIDTYDNIEQQQKKSESKRVKK